MQKGTIGTKQEEPGCSCYRRNYELSLPQIQEETPSLRSQTVGNHQH